MLTIQSIKNNWIDKNGNVYLIFTRKEIQETAKARVDVLTKEFSKQDNVNEELKVRNQLEWVQMMNNCKNRAEEIVFSELIYA